MKELITSNRTVIKSIILCCLFSLMTPTAGAQDFQLRKGNCMPDLEIDETNATTSHRARRHLPALKSTWDPNKTYKQLVILIEFKKDTVKFSCDEPREVYDSIFNVNGYNRRKGKGCVADYYRDQSGGLANFQFDVYGPYTVDYKAQPSSSPDANTHNYGKEPMKAAVNLFLQENPNLDFSEYDWNGDRKIDQVIFVHAGYSGNVNSERVYGYLWPNTSTFSTITTPDNHTIQNYTSSAELWPNDSSCGIGTICHEFTHSLGLPDFYPTLSSAGYSVLDEWDLMDGGNFTNYGCCPPNYTPMEKYLLGWVSFEELTEPTTVTAMKPSSEGGPIYKIAHSNNEYLLLENRQQKDWDLGAPGKGLVIYHVYYTSSAWTGNTVNNNKNKRGYNLMSADNMDYDSWGAYLTSNKLGQYQNSGHMNSRLLSTSPYPYVSETTTNDSLTDTSTPAAQMNDANSAGSTLLGKAITNIKQNADGTISFDFMGGETVTGIVNVESRKTGANGQTYYDLSGRSYQTVGKGGIYIVRQKDGTVRKVFR